MNGLMAIHIAAGLVALPSGALAVGARKGSHLHRRAGTLFAASMLVLGLTAAILEPFRTPPGSPVAGLFVCYFIATSWVTARQGDGATGRFEIFAGAVALGTAALMVLGAIGGSSTTPVGAGPVFALAGLCLFAGIGDIRAYRLRRLTSGQRLSRHLWRMCLAFFIATGSFFLGQQDVLPAAVRGSPFLLVLAFAPFAVMVFWLARLRFIPGQGLPGPAAGTTAVVSHNSGYPHEHDY